MVIGRLRNRCPVPVHHVRVRRPAQKSLLLSRCFKVCPNCSHHLNYCVTAHYLGFHPETMINDKGPTSDPVQVQSFECALDLSPPAANLETAFPESRINACCHARQTSTPEDNRRAGIPHVPDTTRGIQSNLRPHSVAHAVYYPNETLLTSLTLAAEQQDLLDIQSDATSVEPRPCASADSIANRLRPRLGRTVQAGTKSSSRTPTVAPQYNSSGFYC